MDGGYYGGSTYLSGGSTSLEDCAAAVRAYDGQNGCRGAYFFWEYEGYCNCPTDECELGYENMNAGGSGQLYRSDCGDSGSSSGSGSGGGGPDAASTSTIIASVAAAACVVLIGGLGILYLKIQRLQRQDAPLVAHVEMATVEQMAPPS